MKYTLAILFCSVLSFLSTSVYSVSAWPYPIQFTQPDGAKIVIRLKGDEHTKWAETTDGYTILYNSRGFYEYAKLNTEKELVVSGIIAKNPDERSKQESDFLVGVDKHLFFSENQILYLKSMRQIYTDQKEKAFPTTGSRKLICILMGYPDKPFTKTNTDFANLFNQIGYTVDGATGSVRDYYKENSYNQFDLTVTVAGPYVANNNMTYYGANNDDDDDVNPKALITEAVQKADADVNYADFDNDNNGSVDGVYVIFAGYGEEAGAPKDAIWSHAWNINQLTLDGKTISRYSCSPEHRSNTGTGITRIGVICHEFGHVLGAHDYYDTNYETDGQFQGNGYWDLMASGSWNHNGATPAHHNAYTKTQIFNWGVVTTLNSPANITVPHAEVYNTGFYKINTTTAGEYFICENRQQVGFDAYIPGHGLLIYHKHKDGTSNTTFPQMFYPVCASATGNPGETSESYGTINSDGCPFPGTSNKSSFTDVTVPGAKSWANANTGKPLTRIIENIASKTISFDFMGNCTPPTNQSTAFVYSALTDNSVTIGWTRGNGNSVLVLARSGSAINDEPLSGNTYNANAVFGTGEQIGSGNYIVYNGSGNSVNITGLTAGTTYHYSIYEYYTSANCYLTTALTGSATTTGTAPCAVCVSTGSISSDTGITLVNFNTINNATAKPAAYNNYTGLTTTVNKNSSYNLTVKLNTEGSYTVHALAWIDWNQDCDFTDSGETYDLGTANNTTNGNTSLSPLSITIPVTATMGTTRMRVSARYSADPTSCGTAFDGEVEDYSINIAGPDPCFALDYLASRALSISGSYVDLGSNGTIITTSNFDDANSAPQEIGFSFEFNCQTFTQFVLNTNGFIKLGNTAPSAASLFFDGANTAGAGIFNSTNPADVNLISPFNHDLTSGTATPEYRVYTSGSAPNRVCTIQYKNIRDKTTNPLQQYDNMQFQIKLYETTKIIEFIYGDWAPSVNASAFKTSACGLKGSSNAANQLLVVNKGSASAWADVDFTNANYSTTATLNFGKPDDRPKPDIGRTFRFVPTYDNDCSVGEIYAMGEASLHYSNPQSVSVNVVNSGYNDLTNIPVTLYISGVNSFSETKYISSLNYGENKTIVFSDFNATSNGTTNVVISIPDDDYNGNNTKSWVQNTNDYTLNYSTTENSTASWGWTQGSNPVTSASGIFYAKYHIKGSASVTSVKAFIADNEASIGKTVYGVLLNSSGTIIGQSGNYVIQAGDINNWHTFTINTPPTITDADFYAGFAATQGAAVYYPMGSQSENPLRENTYYTSNINGTSLTPKSPANFANRYMVGAILAAIPPVAGVASSNSPVCTGNPANLVLTGYKGSIQWQQSADGSSNWTNVTGGTGTTTANCTTGNLSVTTYYRAQVSQPGFTTLYSNVITVTVNLLPTTAETISGLTTVCQGQNSVTYTVPVISNATSYLWTLPAGASGTSTTNSIVVNYSNTATSGNITVKGQNSCGSGTVSSLAIAVNPLPANAGTISGAINVGRGQNSIIYSVPAIANATSYIWTLPTGATGTSTTNSIAVNYSTSAVSGNITVKGSNSCGEGVASIRAITVGDLPDNAGTILGNTSVCQGQNSVSYSVPAISGATSYTWTLPAGATGTSTTNSITVNFSTSAVSGNIAVKGKNIYGDGSASTLAITVEALPGNAGTITGNTIVCKGQTSVTYSVSAIASATSYIWTLPVGVIGTSTTNSITVNYDISAVSGNVTVRGRNTCGDGPASTFAVTVETLPVNAGTISGLTTVCQGQNSVVYTVPAITHATSYIWTLPDGASGTSTTNSITVNFGKSAVAGNITVKGHNSCGDGGASTLALIVNPLPESAGLISGLTTVCQGQNSVNYTVPAITHATSYIWTLPNGASGISTTNSIVVNFSASSVSGNIVVKGQNVCGDGDSYSLWINIEAPLPVAGTIVGNKTVCQNQSAVVYTVPTITGATSYSWTLPPGATGSSTTNSISVSYGSSSASGNITVKGLNSCGEGVSSSIPITVLPLPVNAGIISGATTVCQGQTSVTYTVPVITDATSYVWTLPSGAIGNSTTNTINVNYGNTSVSGNITVKGNNSCGDGGSSTLAVVVNAKPSMPIITRTADVLHSSSPVGNQWYNQSGLIAGAAGQDFAPTVKGDYWVIVTLTGCSSDPSATFNFIPTGIELARWKKEIKVYPNPVSNVLTIEVLDNKEKIEFEILNSVGQRVFKGDLVDKAIVPTSHFTPGIYLIKLEVGDSYEFKKIVKE